MLVSAMSALPCSISTFLRSTEALLCLRRNRKFCTQSNDVVFVLTLSNDCVFLRDSISQTASSK